MQDIGKVLKYQMRYLYDGLEKLDIRELAEFSFRKEHPRKWIMNKLMKQIIRQMGESQTGILIESLEIFI